VAPRCGRLDTHGAGVRVVRRPRMARTGLSALYSTRRASVRADKVPKLTPKGAVSGR